ncbi:hypothetical protein K470DRAFT_35482 [Piedraia hortae CBS 480.64]|uniref:Galactose oxidase n=1 Tax=Piedraia hortae CBS 480.64 TaxID=1314780 RepID=A0A6A7C396_9PEZI|nr:hypothetical protein K470DRAFT_35482 [Piedraia hortae CBS 480.64]
MSFLFRSSKTRQGPPTTLPPAAREIRSSDGPAPPAYSQAPNGWTNAPKPSSPTPLSAGHGGSLAAIAGHDRGGNTAPAEDRPVLPRDEATAPRIVELPEQKSLRDPPRDGTPQRMAMQPRTSQSDSSPFPWSQCRLALTLPHATPFPRYGAAVNSSASREGSIFIMGGLVDSSTIKSDLWLIEATAGHMTCQPVATTNEGPSLRVGHASLLVGNAFIVFGGDTNVNEGDPLDDTLYLLNTCELPLPLSCSLRTR